MTAPKDFAARLHRDGASGPDVSAAVRETLTQVLGDLPTIATLAYVGDASNGDFLGFATRLEELLGEAAPRMLDRILEAFDKARWRKGEAP